MSFPPGERITQRFLPRMVSSSGGESCLAAPLRAAIVYGNGADADAIAALLTQRGVRVRRLAEDLDDTQLDDQLAAAFVACGNVSLFLALEQPHSLPTQNQEWERDLQQRLLRPFRLCQSWITRLAGAYEGAMLVAVANLGGQFGLDSTVGSPWSGGLSGLCKGIRNENPSLRVKVIDVSPMLAPHQRAERIVSESIDGDRELEVGWTPSGRTVVRYELPDLPEASKTVPARGDIWIVTGGARGVTGVVAEALGRRYGIELHLLGTTAIDPVSPTWDAASPEELKALRGQIMVQAKRDGHDPLQAWSKIEKGLEIRKQLRSFALAGIRATYHVCDLSNWDALQAVLEEVRRRGPIRGIMHGAGFESAAKFEKKKLPLVERTIRSKVGGAAALFALTRNDDLGWFIGFGSTSGRLGGVGQTDYSLANDMLAKQIDWLRVTRPSCRATVFHWHAWDEIGMAARPESRFVLESFGLKFMPPQEGVAYLLKELEAGLPEREVLITEAALCPESIRVQEDHKSVVASSLTNGKKDRRQSWSPTPLFDQLEPQSAQAWVAVGKLYPDRDPFLVEHRMFDRPVLPGVTGWEALVQAVAMGGQAGRFVQLSQVEIVSGLRFATDDPRRFSVHVTPTEDRFHALLRSQASESIAEGGVAKEHVRGVVKFTDQFPHAVASLVPPPFPLNPMVYPEGAAMYHGPRMRTLTGLLFQHGGGWGKLKAPCQEGLAGARASQGWVLPMALLDGSVVGCAVFSWLMCGRRVEIPEGLDELWLLRKPEVDETCQLQFRFLRNTERHSWFDWELFGADNSLIMQCRGMRLVKLGQEEAS